MPFLSSLRLLQVLVFTITILVWVSVNARAETAAEIYPGAIAADHAVSEMARPYVRVYYSRDPIERVKAFYEKELGVFEEIRSGQESYQQDIRRPVITYRHVIHRVIAMEKAAIHPEQVAVEISALRTPEDAAEHIPGSVRGQMAEADMRCRPPSDFFEPLFTMVATQDNRTWEHFNKVCRRYHHLESSLFLPSLEQDERGRTLNQAQAMIRQYHAETSPPVTDAASMEELAEQMQALAMAGRIAEAQALAQRMAEGMRAPGSPAGFAGGRVSADWDGWVKLLGEIDRHAYQTRIMINTDPATWPDRIRLREKN